MTDENVRNITKTISHATHVPFAPLKTNAFQLRDFRFAFVKYARAETRVMRSVPHLSKADGQR